MRKITIITMLVITAVAFTSVQAENFAGYAGAFLRNGIGARPMGMGGAERTRTRIGSRHL